MPKIYTGFVFPKSPHPSPSCKYPPQALRSAAARLPTALLGFAGVINPLFTVPPPLILRRLFAGPPLGLGRPLGLALPPPLLFPLAPDPATGLVRVVLEVFVAVETRHHLLVLKVLFLGDPGAQGRQVRPLGWETPVGPRGGGFAPRGFDTLRL